MTIELTEREFIVLHGSLLALTGIFSEMEPDPNTLHAEQEVKDLLDKLKAAIPAETLTCLETVATTVGLL